MIKRRNITKNSKKKKAVLEIKRGLILQMSFYLREKVKC
jgi:hypothetical protein